MEHMGLVVRKPNKETIVTRLPRKRCRRAELRAALEGMAAYRPAAGLLTMISRCWSRSSTREGGTDRRRLFQFLGRRPGFSSHGLGNVRQQDTARTLDNRTVPLFAFLSIQRSRRFHNVSPGVQPHQPILDALRSRNEAAIKAAFEEHIMRSYQQLSEP
jgi:DNA-binding GntR family transcriptional regulator